MARLRYDMGKDQRDFGLREDESNFKMRGEAQKALHEKIGTMLPPGADGKPDTARAAQYAAGLNAVVAQRMQALQAELARNPANKGAASELEGLQKQGVAGMGEDQIRKYVVGMKAREAANANHSAINPFGGTATANTGPITELRRRPGLISDDYVAPDGTVIPARALDKPGSTFGVGGLRSNEYDILKVR
jgi:hypothetical protein